MKNNLIILLTVFLFLPQVALAGDGLVDDAFDPFSDYSDFVEASTEETDVNFFKFGRMLSIGVLVGTRGFTGNYADNYSSGSLFGVAFTYYLSLQFAVQTSFHKGQNTLRYNFPDQGASFNGKSDFQVFSLHGKYFINTQNLTKSVSKFNPYLLGGFSQYTRDTIDRNQPLVAAQIQGNVGSFDLGAGVEYVFNSNRNFVSFQMVYYIADFPDEGQEITVPSGGNPQVPTGVTPGGDPYSFQVVLGFNF